MFLLAAVTVTPAQSPSPAAGGGNERLKAILGERASTVVTKTTTSTPKLSASADFSLPWYSFNGGGELGGLSATQGLSQSIGQLASGHGSSPDYTLDIGFMAGAEVCNCPYQGDVDEDGFIGALDLGSMIDILFIGAPNLQDPQCPTPRVDFHCDGFSDATDLGAYIDYMFAGGPGPCSPCTDF